tara:strand:+ start:1872 stop:2366 length:495 start_codon:yes stop_codon:yes gene_type:complete
LNKNNKFKTYLRLISTLIIISVFVSVAIYAINFYSQKDVVTRPVEFRDAAFNSGDASDMIKEKVKTDLSNLLSSEWGEYSGYTTEALRVMIPSKEEFELCFAIYQKLQNDEYSETYQGNGVWQIEINSEFLPYNLKRHAEFIKWEIYEKSLIIQHMGGHLLGYC